MKSTSNPLPRALPCRALIVSEPGVDGVFRHVEALVRYLLSREIEVDFAYSDVRSSPDLYALVKFVAIHGGKTLNLRTGNRPILGDTRALLCLWRLVRDHRPGIIHAHSSKAGALVRFLRLVGVRCPIFYTPHAYYGMDTHLKTARLFNMVEGLLAPIGTTINLSKSEAAYARENFGLLSKRQSVRHCGVDCRVFCPPARDEPMKIRRALGIPEEVLLLGAVARYSSQKDPVTLHAAIRDVLPRHENLWFIHVGKGELWDTVNRLGPAVPRLLRLPSFSPMSDFYKALNGFVLASRYEGFSLAGT